jgi:hypothetical protein
MFVIFSLMVNTFLVGYPKAEIKAADYALARRIKNIDPRVNNYCKFLILLPVDNGCQKKALESATRM